MRMTAMVSQPRTSRLAAFSLLESLLGLSIGIVLLAAAVRVLVAQFNSDAAAQRELQRKDDVNRVMGLINDEARNAVRMTLKPNASSLSPIATSTCGNLAPSLIITDTNQLQTAYIFASLTDALNDRIVRSAIQDKGFSGDNILLRCGPSYAQDGSLNTDTRLDVVFDALGNNGFAASPSTASSAAIDRTLVVTLISGNRGTTRHTIQVPLNSNRQYGWLDGGGTGCESGCSDNSSSTGSITYFKAKENGAQKITGDTSTESVIYFSGNYIDYTFDGTCDQDNCIVNGSNSKTTIVNGDVLVFRDRELRL